MAVGEKVLREAQKRYLEAIRVKSEKLVELDDWYRKDLHTFLQDRNNDDKQGAFLTSDELVKLMKWKLTRGKFRPRLEQLAQSNPNDFVILQTKEAFQLLFSSDSSIEKAKEGLLVLNKLKGVGPATSSAILALYKPRELPFMSDEGLEFAADLQGKPKYSVMEWKWYVEKMQERVAKEKWTGGVKELEEAAWAYATLTKNGLWSDTTTTAPTSSTSTKQQITKKKVKHSLDDSQDQSSLQKKRAKE